MTSTHFLYLILLGAIWGGSFLFTRIGIADLGTAWLVMMRVFLGASFLLLAALVFRRSLSLREHWRHWFFLGSMNTAVPFLLFAYGAHELSASLLSIINSTAPMWGVAIGAVLTRGLPGRREIAGLAVGSTGVALLVLRDPTALQASSALPVISALLAPLCYGISSHYARRFTSQLPPFSVALGSQWAAVICVLPLLAFSLQPAVGSFAAVPVGTWWAALALGVLCTGIAYLIFFKLIREIGAPSTLTVTFLIPLFGILWGALFLGEPVSPGTFVGAACVLLGTAWVTGFSPTRLWQKRRGLAPTVPPA